MESKLDRNINRLMRTALVGAVALTGSIVFSGAPAEANAQTPEQKPLPVLVPQPEWKEPTDINLILSMAAKEMQISKALTHEIVDCESRHDPAAVNPSGARGLWQITPVHEDKFAARSWDYWKDWSNAYRNTIVAIEIRRGVKGLYNWSCFRG